MAHGLTLRGKRVRLMLWNLGKVCMARKESGEGGVEKASFKGLASGILLCKGNRKPMKVFHPE